MIYSKGYFRMLKFVKPHAKILIIAFVCMLLSSLFDGASVGMIVPLVDKILAGKQIVLSDSTRVPAIITNLVDKINSLPRGTLLNYIILIVMIMVVFKEILIFLHSYLMTDASKRTVRDVRNKIYGKLLNLSMNFFHRNKTANLMSRITNDTALIQQAVAEGLTEMFYQPLQFLIYFIVLITIRSYFDISWRFVFVIGALFPLLAYPILKIGSRLKKITTQSQVKTADINSLLLEAISGMQVVKAFTMEKAELGKFTKENQRFYKISMKSVKRMNSVRPITEFLSMAAVAVVLWIGGKEVIYGGLSPGAFIAFLAALLSLIKPIKRLSKIHMLNQQAISAGERVFQIMDEKPKVLETKDAFNIKPLAERIIFDKINFSYDKEPVLHSISIEVKKGEIIAIVGPSGAGKSTFVSLIPRFYDPTSGKILIDSQDIRLATLDSLRKQIGLVTQETILFNDTVFSNIAYSRKDASKDDVVRAAKAANAHKFISKFPKGYDTFIGDRGHTISGGERQRLSIARALLKNPPILILDEATSQLDTESEQLVQEALNKLMKNRTVFVIAHRLSTVRNADKIIVLEKGRIEGIGKHDELMETDGLYKKLYQMQFRNM